jgi:hypothetical protein
MRSMGGGEKAERCLDWGFIPKLSNITEFPLASCPETAVAFE